jgi:hypothetical protein
MSSLDHLLTPPAPTDTALTQDTLGKQILDTTGKIGTKTATQANVEDATARSLGAATGISDFNVQLRDVTNQMLALKNEHDAIPLKTQEEFNGRASQTGIDTASVSRQRQIAIKYLGLGSLAATLQGNISTAQDTAKRAVELEFAPEEAKLAYLTKAYELNKDTLQREDKVAADALQVKLAERTRILGEQKDNKGAALALANSAVKNFPKDSAAQTAAQKALALDVSSPNYLQQVFSLVGQYQSDPTAAQKAIDDHKLVTAQIGKLNADAKTAGAPAITNPAVGPYSQALSVILGSAKFTKDQKASVVSAINSGEDPFTVVKNQAKNIMGQTEATTVTKYETAKSALQDLQANLTAFYASGGSTNLFNGNYEKVINSLGGVNDPRLVDLATQIQASLQVYRNAVSGTAYSEQEGKDIASIFPGINKTQGLNMAILKGRMTAFDSTIDGTYRSALGSTYDSLKKANAPKAVSQPAATTLMTGPDGKQYYVPNDKVDAFIKAGGKK